MYKSITEITEGDAATDERCFKQALIELEAPEQEQNAEKATGAQTMTLKKPLDEAGRTRAKPIARSMLHEHLRIY